MAAKFEEARKYYIDNHQLFHTCILILRNLGHTIVYSDEAKGLISAKTNVSVWSMSENINIQFNGDGYLNIISECAMSTQIFDWGKNKANVINIFDAIGHGNVLVERSVGKVVNTAPATTKPSRAVSIIVYVIMFAVMIGLIKLLFSDNKSDYKPEKVTEYKSAPIFPTEINTDDRVIKKNADNKKEKKDDEISNKRFTYQSGYNDNEFDGQVLQTNNEVTYHTFDLNKNVITLKSSLNGEWITIKYPIRRFYKETGLLTSNYVFVINGNGVREIWLNLEIPNLGYDYNDGTRIACYDLIKIN